MATTFNIAFQPGDNKLSVDLIGSTGTEKEPLEFMINGDALTERENAYVQGFLNGLGNINTIPEAELAQAVANNLNVDAIRPLLRQTVYISYEPGSDQIDVQMKPEGYGTQLVYINGVCLGQELSQRLAAGICEHFGGADKETLSLQLAAQDAIPAQFFREFAFSQMNQAERDLVEANTERLNAIAQARATKPRVAIPFLGAYATTLRTIERNFGHAAHARKIRLSTLAPIALGATMDDHTKNAIAAASRQKWNNRGLAVVGLGALGAAAWYFDQHHNAGQWKAQGIALLEQGRLLACQFLHCAQCAPVADTVEFGALKDLLNRLIEDPTIDIQGMDATRFEAIIDYLNKDYTGVLKLAAEAKLHPDALIADSLKHLSAHLHLAGQDAVTMFEAAHKIDPTNARIAAEYALSLLNSADSSSNPMVLEVIQQKLELARDAALTQANIKRGSFANLTGFLDMVQTNLDIANARLEAIRAAQPALQP